MDAMAEQDEFDSWLVGWLIDFSTSGAFNEVQLDMGYLIIPCLCNE